MQNQESIGEIAALRHALHVNHRLRLEFLGGLSKLLREYGLQVSDELLGSLILSVPEEVLNGNGSSRLGAVGYSDSGEPASSPSPEPPGTEVPGKPPGTQPPGAAPDTHAPGASTKTPPLSPPDALDPDEMPTSAPDTQAPGA